MPKVNSNIKSNHNSWLSGREIGNKPTLGSSNALHGRLYSSIKQVGSWDHGENLRNAVHGGVFNLEFSPDGSLLVAACEKKSILMFDPLNHRMIHGIDNAHNECVNCVRFLDSRVFATCSDDTTVALWDARNLKHRIQTLRGHKNWVKNIEYSAKDELLVTSGFDGSIYTWDINNYSEKRVFHTNGLMRMRLTPDASKMVISTTAGYMMIVHGLDLANLGQDLIGFKPNMYRQEQQNEWCYPNGETFTHLFAKSRKRNRVEFITDFPNQIEAEVISSLQVHPQGWCALSRCICSEERAEWTCVHDIQDKEDSDAEDDATAADTHVDSDSESDFAGFNDPPSPIVNPLGPTPHPRVPLASPAVATAANRPAGNRAERDSVVRRVLQVGEIVRQGATYTANVELQISSSDVWEALVAVSEARVSDARVGTTRVSLLGYRNNNNNSNNNNRPVRPTLSDVDPSSQARNASYSNHSSRIRLTPRSANVPTANGSSVNIRVVPNSIRDGNNPAEPRPGTSQRTVPFAHGQSRTRKRRARLHQNVPRLLNYIEEPNVGKGFIKELCFSSDGRLISSPFSFGVRLLAFSPECAELSTCTPNVLEPVKLYELGSNICHSNTVVSTKFSPQHCLLVSGCLNGKIVWYQPKI